MEKYIVALDQGTTSSRCIIFDKKGKICKMTQKELAQYYPHPGWVEEDPREIWSSQYSVMTEAIAALGIDGEQIAGIGITNQRETTIIWDKHTGKPVYNAIVWQCRRTADMIDRFQKEMGSEKVQSKTGLIPDAYFSASKIAWILDHTEGAREAAKRGDLLFGTVDTWLIWNLTGKKVHVTDYTNASRTMLYDIHNLCWDQELLDWFDIPGCMLPKVCPSSYIYGYTDEMVLAGNVPIAAAAGDQQAALFGQCCFAPGDVKNTYGTGCFLLMNTGTTPIASRHGLLTTIAAGTDGQVEYALEGSVFVAGASIQWLRDQMQLIHAAPESETCAAKVDDTNGVYVVPAFTGLGAPYWNPYARGMVVGLTRGCTKEHFVRATLESIAYQANDVICAMQEDAGVELNELKVDGGASANNLLMQMQSDLNQAVVYRPECIETTALGAAYLAGLAVGVWKDKDEIRQNWKLGRKFTPDMQSDEREKKLRGWERAVRCVQFLAEDSEESDA